MMEMEFALPVASLNLVPFALNVNMYHMVIASMSAAAAISYVMTYL